MKKKVDFTMDAAVVAIGLVVILSVAVWVINANDEFYSQSLVMTEASDAVMLQQRDVVIGKLVKKVKAKQIELANAKKEFGAAKAELDAASEKIEAIKTVVQ